MTTFDELLAAARLRAVDAPEVLALVGNDVLPEWVETFYPEQATAIRDIVEAFRDNDVVLLDAPTGCGKTLIAEAVRQLMRSRMVFVCHTKSLQEQFMRDFKIASLLQGRSNYPTEDEELFYGPLAVSAADCTKESGHESSCRWCSSIHNCPYERAKAQALKSEIAVLNARYFLTEANGPGRFSRRDYVVVDEADTLESELMSFVEFDLSPKRIRDWGLGEPKFITKEEAWLEWVKAARQKMGKLVIPLRLLNSSQDEIAEIREAKVQAKVKKDLEVLEAGLSTGQWVYTGKSGRVSFKPLKVDSIANEILWRHSKKWLLMSASIISPEQRMKDLGFSGKWKCISMTSPFRKEDRRIIVRPAANVSKRGVEEDGLDGLLEAVRRLLDTHRGQRVLLHTVSYELTNAVTAGLRDREFVLTYDSARGRELALQQYKATAGAVLVAPSMDRGIDLPGELCRVVGICKVPFGFLGDRQVSGRLHSPGGRSWYNVQAVSSIIQMSGRGVRNREDWCVTYILDKQFRRLFNQNRGLFPGWWKDALTWE